jgi:hypothetical protein
MGASYLIGILIVVYSALRPKPKQSPTQVPAGIRIPAITTLCISLCLLFACELSIIQSATHTLVGLPAYIIKLPIPMIASGLIHRNDVDAYRAMLVEGISIGESVTLLALAMLFPPKEKILSIRVILAFTAIVLGVLAVRSPSMLSSDLYIYVAHAEIANAYHPNHIPLPGDSAIINTMWGNPLVPSAYGPLWIAISKIAIAPFPTLAGKLLSLRCMGLIEITLCILLLIGIGISYRAIALTAVNPAMYDSFVSEGHNDLLGIVFILTAALARRKSLPLAMLCVIAAGLIKAPLILIGALVFAAESRAEKRILLGLSSICLGALASVLFGGPWYLHALHRVNEIYINLYGQFTQPIDIVLHAALTFISVAAIGLAIMYRRSIPGAAWSMPALAPSFIAANYLGWSLPYALLTEEPNLLFLASWPTAAYLLNTDYAMTPFFILLRAVLIAVPTVGISVHFLQRRHRLS